VQFVVLPINFKGENVGPGVNHDDNIGDVIVLSIIIIFMCGF